MTLKMKVNLKRVDPLQKKENWNENAIRLTFRIPKPVKQRVDQIAKKKKVSLNSLLVHLIIRGVKFLK